MNTISVVLRILVLWIWTAFSIIEVGLCHADPMQNKSYNPFAGSNPFGGGGPPSYPGYKPRNQNSLSAPLGNIPGIDISGLNDSQRNSFLTALSSEGCPCGCQLNLLQCRIQDSSCQVSLNRARTILGSNKVVSPMPNRPTPYSQLSEQPTSDAQFKTQQSQLQARIAQCMAEMKAATDKMARGAMNGMMFNNRPACEQYMPQWIAQKAYLETEIYRLKTGDRRSTVREITGISGPSAGSGTNYYSPSRDGTNAVDNWDRQSIRGNSIYTDENGKTHELPTHNYYFRDRSNGQFIPSDAPDPPNDGRDYERIETNNPR